MKHVAPDEMIHCVIVNTDGIDNFDMRHTALYNQAMKPLALTFVLK